MAFADQSTNPSLREHVRLMAIARLSIWLSAQIFLLINHFFLNLALDILVTELILSILLILSLITFVSLKYRRNHSSKHISIQLSADVLVMTLLFHVTGGAANPFVSLLLFPLTISAAILSTRFTWFMVLFTLSAYGSLFMLDLNPSSPGWFENSMPHHDHSHHEMAVTDNDKSFSLHIIGMWFNFALSAILISFFIVRMNREIKRQAHQINQQREQMLRDEQVLGIATQAASAAHHMSTPLATMAVLVDDLKHDYTEGELADDLLVLSNQINNCNQVLDGLRDQAHQGHQAETLGQFLQQLLNEFQLLRPGINLTSKHSMTDQETILRISSDPALRMAILNILNNAADVSPEHIRFESYVEQEHVHFIVDDFAESEGEQLKSMLAAAEQPQSSHKEHGMGLGLFLSHATINRHQGQISIQIKQQPGTQVHISLPVVSSITTKESQL